MPRMLLVCQEKGGVGKSLIARALAEAVPGAPIIEIDASRRLLELEDRVQYFPMRADRAVIETTGGEAARAEFDPVINALGSAELPTIIDVGANTALALLAELAAVRQDLLDAGVELGVLVLITRDRGAIAEVPKILAVAERCGAARFVLENRVDGAVEAAELKRVAGKVPVCVLENHAMGDEAVALLQGGGLAAIPQLEAKKLNTTFGLALGARILRDLRRLRADAIESVKGPATWLIEGA